MDSSLDLPAAPAAGTRGETQAHRRLKRLAMLWAQAQGYSACALEVSLPRCRYRADVAGYRRTGNGGATAIFECKQVLADLRRDNCQAAAAEKRLETVARRRETLEKHLRIHYPTLRVCDCLFPEFDSHDFAAIEHRGYRRVMSEVVTLQNRIRSGTKFEALTRYRCANLFFLVVTETLCRENEVPPGWGLLVESGDSLVLRRKPVWHESPPEQRLRFLERIARVGTRHANRELEIAHEDIVELRRRGIL